MAEAIAVIIPVFNAAPTLGATLESVRRQTHAELEIVVVDDGSTDASPEIAAEQAAADPRLRVVRQPNSGVAAARNLGAALTSAEYLAFIDADDLWAPPKMALQLAAMQEGGRQVGLVYSWSAIITGEDVVTRLSAPQIEGDVLAALCRGNFIGNASTALIRRAAFERAGGFDSSLRDRGAQGCEDLGLFLGVAETFEFRVVRSYLTGYRVLPNSMSGNARAMYKSCQEVLAPYYDRYPEYRPLIERQLYDVIVYLMLRTRTGWVAQLPMYAQMLWERDPLQCVLTPPRLIKKGFAALLATARSGAGAGRLRYQDLGA